MELAQTLSRHIPGVLFILEKRCMKRGHPHVQFSREPHKQSGARDEG